MAFHHDQVVADEDFNRNRGQFADETADDVVPIADVAHGTEGSDESVWRVRDGPGDGHGLPRRVVVDLAQHLAGLDDFLSLIAKEGPHEKEADDDADRFGNPRDNRSADDAEDDAVCRRDEDGRQEADDVDDDVDDHADNDGPAPEGAQVVDGPVEVAAHREVPDGRVKVGDEPLDGTKEDQEDQEQGDFKMCLMDSVGKHYVSPFFSRIRVLAISAILSCFNFVRYMDPPMMRAPPATVIAAKASSKRTKPHKALKKTPI